MAKRYSNEELLKIIEKAAEDMPTFYQQKFVNYNGENEDGKYSETIAAYLMEHNKLFENIKTILRDKPYIVKHSDTGKDVSNREEERLAKSMFNKHYNLIGKVIDYQTPLKNIREDIAGKIDMLAYDSKTRVLSLIELKRQDSKETLLRCILEIYTYIRTIDINRLKEDFRDVCRDNVEDDHFGFRPSKEMFDQVKFVPTVLVFKDGIQHEQMSLPNVCKLSKMLGVRILLLSSDGKIEEATL